MRRKPETINDDLKAIFKNLGLFDLSTLGLLQRIDKFEATDVGSSGEGPKPKHSISDPTGSRVVQKLSGKKVHDPVGSAVKEIDFTIFQIRRMTEVLIQQRDYVLNPRERHRETMIAHCGACERIVACTSSDRLRSDFCYQCYRRWLKEGKPNRTQFVNTIRSEAA